MENNKILKIVIEQKILIVIAVIAVFLSFRSPYFLTYYNIVNIFSFISIEGVIVIGMTFLMILGEIDLSVGAVMAFSTILAVLFQPYGLLAGVVAGIAGGALIGFVNGTLVTKLRLSSIPVTLGMMVMVNGIVGFGCHIFYGCKSLMKRDRCLFPASFCVFIIFILFHLFIYVIAAGIF